MSALNGLEEHDRDANVSTLELEKRVKPLQWLELNDPIPDVEMDELQSRMKALAFFAEENPEKSGDELTYSAFSEWSDQKIAAYLKDECERDFKRGAKLIADTQSQRARLWSLVPQAERAKVEAYIKMRRAQDKRKGRKLWQEFSQKFGKL